jgi:hypothetical protein
MKLRGRVYNRDNNLWRGRHPDDNDPPVPRFASSSARANLPTAWSSRRPRTFQNRNRIIAAAKRHGTARRPSPRS